MSPPVTAPPAAVSALPPIVGAAIALPVLLAYNVSPSATFLNQALSIGLWGLAAAVLALATPIGPDARRAIAWAVLPPAVVLGWLAGSAAFGSLVGSVPASLSVSAVGVLLTAAVVLVAGARAGAAGLSSATTFWRACAVGLVVAGLAQAAVAAVQVFAPGWADGVWVARSALPGRAVGNLRQPNHVCTLLLLAMVGTVSLAALVRPARPRTLWLAGAVLAVLAWALVATASRTAWLGLAVLLGWGLLDRSLSAPVRRLLVASPALYAVAWAAMAAWSRVQQQAFAAESRLSDADLSASRLAIWSDSLQLIQQQPWWGVGFGEFNFAWSLTVLPSRPVAFFDHAHNLLLHWAVELGLPAALLLCAALALALLLIGRAAVRGPRDGASTALLRPLLVALLIVAVHSQLEYPLWYAYFLLPTAAWLGLGLVLASPAGPGADPPGQPETRGGSDGAAAGSGAEPAVAFPHAPPPATRPWRGVAAGVAVALGALVAVVDYQRVTRVFAADDAAPLAQRIADGQRSWFFGHHADYAAATVTPEPAQELEALRRASHHLLDTRLMMAWADAYASSGDVPRARYLAARLREFRNPASAPYFAACAQGSTGTETQAAPLEPPYQCRGSDPRVRLRWTDFR